MGGSNAGWLPFALLLAGILSLGAAAWATWRTSSFVARSRRSAGTIVENVKAPDDTMYTPRVRFRDGSGREVTFLACCTTDPPLYSVGDEVCVFYEPANTGAARIDSFWDLWIMPSVGVVAGGVMLLIGILAIAG